MSNWWAANLALDPRWCAITLYLKSKLYVPVFTLNIRDELLGLTLSWLTSVGEYCLKLVWFMVMPSLIMCLTHVSNCD